MTTALSLDNSLHNASNPFLISPAVLVDLALRKLQEAGIELVEWRALTYRRMSVPVIVKDFSYIVSSSDITLASKTLEEMSLPLSDAPKLLSSQFGDLFNKAHLHRITVDTMETTRFIALFPSSFVSFLPSELSRVVEEDTGGAIDATHDSRLDATTPSPPRPLAAYYIPKPSAVYASLLRLISQYPQHERTRSTLEVEFGQVAVYHLLDQKRGVYGGEEDEVVDEFIPDEDPAVRRAVGVINGWFYNDEWREGEEWIGDVLIAFVRGEVTLECMP